MNHFSFSDLKLGQSESFRITVNIDMMNSFRTITGDVNPLHNNKQYALEHGFDANVCFGMLTASFLSTLAGVYLPGEKSLIQSIETKFLRPVIVGDILIITGEVGELNDTVEQVVLNVVIKNQRNEKVLRGKMKVGFVHEG